MLSRPPKHDRLQDVLQHTSASLAIFRDVAQTTHGPFLGIIASLSASIINSVQTVRSKQYECLQMVDKINQLLCALINFIADLNGILPPVMLRSIGTFSETPKKIYSFVDTHQGKSTFKRFLQNAEISAQLEDCKAGLHHALDVFNVYSQTSTAAELGGIRMDMKKHHENLLTLLHAQEGSTDMLANSMDRFSVQNSTSTLELQLIPGSPQIFHGRDAELEKVVGLLLGDSARIAILGTGGVGKTSLALAALHHPDIVAQLKPRYFVSCTSSLTSNDILSEIASVLGIETKGKLLKEVLTRCSRDPPSILVLDNLETPWEALASRNDVEELLTLLTDVSHLNLLITMRRSERPLKVRWSRPFLEPLQPLSNVAARQTFLDIADDDHDAKGIDSLLQLADNLPLAVTLLANIASSEGCDRALARWEAERTSLISDGHDQRSNLDISIMLSISSPRMMVVPGARDLLSLLSLLPDGISDLDLFQSDLPVAELPRSKAALMRTSLAYVDRDKRLKILSPIREYVRVTHPPPVALVQPIQKHFNDLVTLWRDFRQLPPGDLVSRIKGNLGNLHSVLSYSLRNDPSNLEATVRAILFLNSFFTVARSPPPLMLQLAGVIGDINNPQLRGMYITERFANWVELNNEDSETIIAQAIEHFKLADDPKSEARFCNMVGTFRRARYEDTPRALEMFHRALTLAEKVGDTAQQSAALSSIALSQWQAGEYRKSQINAGEALERSKLGGDFFGAANALRIAAMCCVSVGDFKRSAAFCAEGRELLHVCGLEGIDLDLMLISSEADTHFCKSEYTEARKILVHLAEIQPAEKSAINHAYAQCTIAGIDIITEADEEKIRERLNLARALVAAIPYPRGITLCDVFFADLDLREGRIHDANAFYEQCFASCRATDEEVAVSCLDKLSDVSFGMHSVQTSLRWAVVALIFGQKCGNAMAIHHALRCLGDIFAVQGDPGTALALFEVALDGFTDRRHFSTAE
ncbi:hypothetical protein B0H19DRAFT_1135353 [Mycena capillaripes]|nr:hypothetical protein B0H19DRAFT_1135353 [Mycena capillaripes]